jgi:hypothetical protein
VQPHRLPQARRRARAWVGYVATQERLLAMAVRSTCSPSKCACGMAAALPLPLKRHPAGGHRWQKVRSESSLTHERLTTNQ